jgi:hypothetical protein
MLARMPKHAHLQEELRCPDCHAAVIDLAWFQWGYCANHGVVDEYLYRIGDAIRWATADDGSTPAWTYFEIDNHGGNLGDPAVTDLVVKEVAELYWTHEPDRRRCPGCGQPLEGAAIEIRGGVIRRAWIYRAGELARGAEIHVFAPDGRLVPRPAWNDHPMVTVAGGRRPPR